MWSGKDGCISNRAEQKDERCVCMCVSGSEKERKREEMEGVGTHK